VTDIGEKVFYACPSLTSITVSKDNKVYDSREDCNAIIHTSSNILICKCTNTIIPPSVTEIKTLILNRDYNFHNDYNYDEPSYGRYAGSYAQDVEGWSDNDIDDVFDGDPDAYWNID
jgi:hypothetical protein